MSEPEAKASTISPDKLSTLTGTTVPDLERLTKQGYLPAKEGAGYPMVEAINGWFRWHRQAAVTVSADELRSISGLSDQRHRQLASEGQFPPPIRGQYDLKKAAAGLIRHFKELNQRREENIGKKREAKLDKENTILEMDILERRHELASLDDMDRRFRPMLAAARQKILASTMTDDEKDELLTEMSQLLTNALTRDFKGSETSAVASVASDMD